MKIYNEKNSLEIRQTADIQGSYKVTFEGYSGFTGLQVKKDPGVWIIWLGCFLLVGGMLLAFYWQPMVVSGVITPNEAVGKLFFGAATGKYASRVKDQFEGLVSMIKEKSNT